MKSGGCPCSSCTIDTYYYDLSWFSDLKVLNYFSAMLHVPVPEFYSMNDLGSRDTEIFLGIQKRLMISYLAVQ